MIKVEKEQMPSIAKELFAKLNDSPIMLFIGNLGAGKTTLIKEILNIAGVEEVVSSPTFSIVNVYENAAKREIYHFDCYRLKNLEEALDIGMDEYIDSGNICLIEWPEIIENLLDVDHWKVEIEHLNQDSRYISISKIEV